MIRLLLMTGLLLISIVPQAWGSMKLPAACNGFLNKTITNAENIWNTPSQAQANVWRRCNAIVQAKQAAKLKALKARRQAWINSQNQ